MLLDFGMAAVAEDGYPAGVLDAVLVDRDRNAVTHLVIRSDLASEDLLLPIDLVQGTIDGEVRLRPRREDLTALPRYYEGRTSDPPAGRADTALVPEPADRRQSLDEALGITDEAVELNPDTRLMTTDAEEAALIGVASEEPGNTLSLLHARGPAGGDAQIPASLIDVMREDVVALNASRDDLLRLHPSPRPPKDVFPDLEGLSSMGDQDEESPEES